MITAMSSEFFPSFTNVIIPANDNVQLFARIRGIDPGDRNKPILVLIHGYPQSSWEFRFAPQYLPPDLPLFIPDLPGYGESTKSVPTTETSAYSKHAIGRDILDGLAKCLGLVAGGGGPKQKVILCGHDRGARIIQRIAFDFEDYPLFDILGIVLGDIVPITVQFQSFANPVHAAATYHWSLLAAPYPIPETMIEKYGGPEWVGNCLTGWGGTSEKGRANFLGPTGVEVFKQHFIKPSVIAASCADYRAAAHIDAQLEAKDHEEGKRIKFQTLVVYSKKYLGSRYDVTAVWREYMSYKERLTTCGIEEVGHFCFEEDPMPCYVAITDWMREVLRLDM